MNEKLEQLDTSLARVDRLLGLARYLVGGLISLVFAVFGLGIAYKGTLDDIAHLDGRVTAIEQDRAQRIPRFDETVSGIKQDLATTKNDVSWIRTALERSGH